MRRDEEQGGNVDGLAVRNKDDVFYTVGTIKNITGSILR